MSADDCWKNLGQINEWIRFADTKATAVLTASGVIGGLLIKSAPTVAGFKSRPAYAVLLALAICTVGYSALMSLLVFMPRLRAGEARSLIYFEHIARRYSGDRASFVDNYLNLSGNEENLSRQITEQIWANSLVGRKKYRRVAFASRGLGATMLLAGLAVLVERLWS